MALATIFSVEQSFGCQGFSHPSPKGTLGDAPRARKHTCIQNTAESLWPDDRARGGPAYPFAPLRARVAHQRRRQRGQVGVVVVV